MKRPSPRSAFQRARFAAATLLSAALLAAVSPTGAQPAPSKPAPSQANSSSPKPATKPAARPTSKPSKATPKLRDTLAEDARAAFDRAGELFKDGDFAGARAEYERTLALSGNQRVAYNVAACDKALRKYARSYSVLAASLEKGGDALPSDHVELVRETMRVLETFVSRLTVESNEDGARVLVDGELAGTTPLPAALVVDTGSRSIKLEKVGFESASTTLEMVAEAPSKVALRLVAVKPPPPPPPASGKLRVNTDDATSRILVDGRQVGTGAWAGSVSPGPHVVRVERPGAKPYASTLELRAGEQRTLDVTLPAETTIPTWVWIAGGVAVAAGAAVAIGVAAAPTRYNGSTAGTLAPKVVPVAIPIGGTKW